MPKKGVTVARQLRQGLHRRQYNDENTMMIVTIVIVATVVANVDA